ncbi:hypothetical protein CP533_6019 [Ophiocordyceps camponoti-saundersi (nom. inval.)]|nr:hypothetical protein CP533_6019 [Ophiocordyceps camponoti-saundersi (nom. inval.)]
MPLHFFLVCRLLDECERLCSTGKSNSKVVADWFAHHRSSIHAHDVDLGALLSTLLPEKRTDRVYCIQVASLEKIIARALMLGSSRVAELARYRQPGLGLDLADCVERILKATPNPVSNSHDRVTVEELDVLLHDLASGIRWSSPAIRRSRKSVAQGNRDDLECIYRRLDPAEAKWFTRLVLKNFQPVILDPNVVFACCHPLLPSMIKIQDDFTAAIRMLRHVKGELLRDSALTAKIDRTVLLSLKPEVGVKVGRQNWLKARSIKHCFNLGYGRMSIEEKIDGEYCQIHVDVTAKQSLQIFSKSGKDSTEDRQGLHGAIYESLRIGRTDCNFRTKCILEGELVVYSHRENKILPFHRIRNHVTRRGLFLNTGDDSRPDACEELMIIYFDMLLIDDRSLLNVRRSERFELLRKTVHAVKGRADFVPRQVVDFEHPYAVSDLRKAFAQVIVAKGEGLVLKPDDPYFNFYRHDLPFTGRCIKFKKEYIGNLGDVGDFAVVGAGFDASKAKTYNIPNLQWTQFYLGCLENKEQVLRWKATPVFTVVAAVELNASQLKMVLSSSFPSPISVSENQATRLKVPKGIETDSPMLVAFGNPLVFDIRCFSFDKPGNTGFWTLRFPCVSKIHFDRDFRDTVSFDELQAMAQSATTLPEADDDSQENLEWIARLEEADPRRLPVDTATQSTATTVSTPSPAKSTQTTSQHGFDASPIVISDDENIANEESARAWTKPRVLFPCQQLKPPAGCAQKQSTSPLDTRSKTRKRRRSREPEAASLLPAGHGSREPLLDLSGNLSLLREEIMSEKAKSGDLQQACENACARDVEASRTRKPASLDGNRAQGGVARGRDLEAASWSTDTPNPVTQCSYAASNCKLTAYTILVSSASIIDDAEPAALLKAHGVLGSVALADAWLKSLKEPAGESKTGIDDTTNLTAHMHEARRDQSKLMLLVDTIGPDAAESKALVARIDELQRDLPHHLRTWITVYDWRVLRNISIAEDKSRPLKRNYDGFSDPWRRWHCGYC